MKNNVKNALVEKVSCWNIGLNMRFILISAYVPKNSIKTGNKIV